MATYIQMPKLSDTMTVGQLVKWLKKEGAFLKVGDILAEVETDKATMEVENFEEGTLLKCYVTAGERVPVGKRICAIGAVGETLEEEEEKPELIPASVTKAPVVSSKKPTEPEPLDVALTPVSAVSQPSQRIKATPVARKIAAENGIALHTIQGSGPGGRIRKADVLAALQQGTAVAISRSAVKPIATERAIPASEMRITIAQRLVESKTEIPHFYLEIEIEATPLLELRATLNKNLAEAPSEKDRRKLTLNDFILKACTEALRAVPAINVSWQEDALQQWGSVHLAFGVAVDDGLLTPIIRDAHTKGLREISQEAKTLITKARTKKLTPAELTGSTFTVTNLGMFGIPRFYGIINPPNAGILSVGAIIKKPIVSSDGTLGIGQLMALGLSGDHRAINGASAAQYLSKLKEILETPALMLL